MTARNLRQTIALLTLLTEIRYTISRLSAATLLPAFLAQLQVLRDQWTAVQAREISFHEALSDAYAQIDIADDHLDDFAIRFSNAVMVLTGQKRDAKLYKHFFKKPLREFLRPTLSGQLAAMASWIKSLEEATTPPTLAAMLPELVTLVDAGTKAAALRDDLKAKIKQFREVGERRQLIDQVNALRKELAGALAKMPQENAALPTDFASHFFKPSEAGEDEQEETIDSLEAEIKKLERALLEKKARLVELQEAAEEDARKADKKAKKAEALAKLDKEIEEKQKAKKEIEEEPDDE